jgi:hypothetical protein
MGQFFYWQKDDNGYHIMVDGERTESFPAWFIEELKARPEPFTGTFDGIVPGRIDVVDKPDGREFIYEVTFFVKSWQVGTTYFIKNGQKILDGYKNIFNLVISPDGNKVAGIFRDKMKYYIALDGKVISPGFLRISYGKFCSDNTKLLYVGMNWKYSIMMNAQKISPDFYDISGLSGEDSQLTYIANQGGKYFVMVNHQPVTEKFDKITDYLRSADHSKLAYAVLQKGHSYIMMNDRKVTPEFPKEQQLRIIRFSPDSSKVCYKISVEGKQPQQWLMAGDQAITPQLSKLDYGFAADGRIFFAGLDKENREIVRGVVKPW